MCVCVYGLARLPEISVLPGGFSVLFFFASLFVILISKNMIGLCGELDDEHFIDICLCALCGENGWYICCLNIEAVATRQPNSQAFQCISTAQQILVRE